MACALVASSGQKQDWNFFDGMGAKPRFKQCHPQDTGACQADRMCTSRTPHPLESGLSQASSTGEDNSVPILRVTLL